MSRPIGIAAAVACHSEFRDKHTSVLSTVGYDPEISHTAVRHVST